MNGSTAGRNGLQNIIRTFSHCSGSMARIGTGNWTNGLPNHFALSACPLYHCMCPVPVSGPIPIPSISVKTSAHISPGPISSPSTTQVLSELAIKGVESLWAECVIQSECTDHNT